MASYDDQAKVKIASSKPITKRGVSQHVTTCNFMQFQPVFYRHLIKGSKLDVDVSCMTRLLALQQPTFGRVQHHIKAFFVPYRLVFKGYDDFIADTVHVFGNGVSNLITQNRFFRQSSIQDFFVRVSTPLPDSATGVVSDWTHFDSQTRYVFTPYGRRCYKIFKSLGYDLAGNTGPDFGYDATALLALARVYLDWFYPSAYVGTPDYNFLEGICQVDLSDRFEVLESDLVRLFEVFDRVCYESDYFTSAFDNPVGPNSIWQMSSITMRDQNLRPDADGLEVENNPDGSLQYYSGSPILRDEGSSLSSLTYYAIRALRQMTAYMARHRIAGARAIDRFLAKYGDVTTEQKLQRAQYLGHYDLDMEVRSIESTAATADASLADFAGQAVIRSKDRPGHFHCEVDEDGFFVIVSSIVPVVQYVQGIDGLNLRRGKLDYYTQEFDGLGTDPILRRELLSVHNTVGFNGNMSGIFGFAPRYARYKICRDWLSGDFACPSISQAGDTSKSWHLSRLFDESDYASDYDELVHSEDFIRGRDADQYLRIFQTQDEDTDHLVQYFMFAQKLTAPWKDLYDSMDFEHEEGRQIDIRTNGVRLN